MSLFLYNSLYLIGHFSVMLIFMLLAIVAAKSKYAWIVYACGAVFQLLSLSGNQKEAGINGTDISLLWVVYFILLLVSAILIVVRYNNAKGTVEIDKRIAPDIELIKKLQKNSSNSHVSPLNAKSENHNEQSPQLPEHCFQNREKQPVQMAEPPEIDTGSTAPSVTKSRSSKKKVVIAAVLMIFLFAGSIMASAYFSYAFGFNTGWEQGYGQAETEDRSKYENTIQELKKELAEKNSQADKFIMLSETHGTELSEYAFAAPDTFTENTYDSLDLTQRKTPLSRFISEYGLTNVSLGTGKVKIFFVGTDSTGKDATYIFTFEGGMMSGKSKAATRMTTTSNTIS